MSEPSVRFARDLAAALGRVETRLARLGVRNQRCNELLEHAPARVKGVLLGIAFSRAQALAAAALAPAVARLAPLLAAVKGADPILDAGADGFATVGDVLRGWARTGTADVCAEARAWSRRGYSVGAEPTGAFIGGEILELQAAAPAIKRAGRRLFQLGAKGMGARAWDITPFVEPLLGQVKSIPDALLDGNGEGVIITFGGTLVDTGEGSRR